MNKLNDNDYKIQLYTTSLMVMISSVDDNIELSELKIIISNEKNMHNPPAIEVANSWNAWGLVNWASIKSPGLYLCRIVKKYL